MARRRGLRQSSFVASYFQQRTSNLHVKHLAEANKLLRQLKANPVTLRYMKMVSNGSWDVYMNAYASFNLAASLFYGQTGAIVGLRIPFEARDLFHWIYWLSQMQRRISHSSYKVKILTCADGDDRGYHIKNCTSEMMG